MTTPKDAGDVLRMGGQLVPRGEPIELPPDESSSPSAETQDAFSSKWKTLGEWGEDWLSKSPPRRRWLLERDDAETNAATRTGVLPFGKVGMLVAAGGVGKTMALAQLALAVACGRKWLNTFHTPREGGHVVLALGEEDEEEVQRRLYNAAGEMQLTDEQRLLAAERIVVLPLAGTAVALTENDGLRNTAETGTLKTFRERLDAAGHDWSLIIMDPLSRFAGCDTEKDNAAATRFIEAAESLAKAPGKPTVLLAHHTNKAERRDDSGASTSADARGASGLTDGVRWVANIKPGASDDRAELAITKSNYSLRGEPVHLLRSAAHSGALRAETTAEKQARLRKDDESTAGKPKPVTPRNGKASERELPDV